MTESIKARWMREGREQERQWQSEMRSFEKEELIYQGRNEGYEEARPKAWFVIMIFGFGLLAGYGVSLL